MWLQPNHQFVASPSKAVHQAAETAKALSKELATELISAEERLRLRIASALRVTLATLFFLVSGLISLGASATVAAASALAKKVSPQTQMKERTERHKKSKSHLRMKMHHHHMVAAAPKMHHGHQRGIASWYGGEFRNRPTASGVRFNTDAMTAAHRTLPFGSTVKVTNLVNHRSCVVKITDRGPFKPGRIIDLSHAAAQRLGMATTGTAPVEIEVLTGVATLEDIASESYEDAPSMHVRPVFDHIPAHLLRADATP